MSGLGDLLKIEGLVESGGFYFLAEPSRFGIGICLEHLKQITYVSYPIYFLSSSPIIIFTFMVASVVADYSK